MTHNKDMERPRWSNQGILVVSLLLLALFEYLYGTVSRQSRPSAASTQPALVEKSQ